MRPAFALALARRFGAAGTLAASIALASACTTNAEKPPYFGKTVPPAGQVMRYISGSEPESLDPQVSTGQPEARLYVALYDGLTEYHPETAEAIPSLAERWEPNADNSEFTFYLRDAKWSNGDPLTAHDFVYSLGEVSLRSLRRARRTSRTTSGARRRTTRARPGQKTSASKPSTITR